VTIWVTGGQGFIGTAVCRKLGEVDLEVVAPPRHRLDLADAKAVDDFVSEIKPVAVVHLAASLDRRGGADAERSQWRDTLTASVNVIRSAAAAGVKRIVAAGSLEELGQQGGVLYPSATGTPASTYGLVKSLARQVAEFEGRRRPLRVDWFRPTIVYGPGQDGPMLVPSAFRAAMAGGGGAFTTGEQRGNLLYVDDLADWVRAALRVPWSAVGLRLHHVGGASTVAVRDVLTAVAAEFGVTLAVGALPRREGEPDLQTVAPFRSEEWPLAEWRPCVDLREGVKRTADWWRSHG